MEIERTLANRRFLDGILDSTFSFLITNDELVWQTWELLIDVSVKDQWNCWRDIRKGAAIFITRVEVDVFYFVLKKHHRPHWGSEDYEDIECVSYDRGDKDLHWNEMFG